MARSKADLATATLQLIGVLDATEAPSAEDSAYVEARYDDLRDELVDKGLAYWPSTTRTTAEIPAVVFSAAAMILAGRCAPTFQVAEPVVTDDDGKQMPASAKGWRDLRRHLAKPASGQPTRATYY
jgi:hypothetical protein